MDSNPNQETPFLLSSSNIIISKNNNRDHHQEQPPPPPVAINNSSTGGGGGGGGGDRLKRDEWSEGAVSSLLEAYEAKWTLRNRAKLKGQDWEDVAKFVSSRANSTKSPKTQTQCKNKIESMKKRYRSESATADVNNTSSWPLYSRLDHLLRGNSSNAPPHQPPLPGSPAAALPLIITQAEASQPPRFPPPPPVNTITCGGKGAQNSQGSNGIDRVAKEDGDEMNTKAADQESDKHHEIETDSSTPALYSDKSKVMMRSKSFKSRTDNKRKKQRSSGEELEIAESIRWLAEVIMRSEEARLETAKEIEKMRAEAEAKRGEMDLRRTEIIANTQLEIAKIFAGVVGRGGGGGGRDDDSLRIGRS